MPGLWAFCVTPLSDDHGIGGFLERPFAAVKGACRSRSSRPLRAADGCISWSMAERGDWISFGDVSGISEGLALLPKCGDAQKAAILKGLYATF